MTTTITEPFLSVVTITRNNLAGLRATADSILMQSCKDFEWIIIDGNSNDGTKDFLVSLPADWISEPDGGIYDAMNKGLDRAKGRYVIFMNAGDCFSDADIVATLERAGRYDPDFIYGDALETGGFYKKARTASRIGFGMPTHHQAMLYRHAAIGDLRYDTKYKIAADYDFTARFLNIAPKTHYIPCAICIFDTGGISQTNQKLGRAEQLSARRQLSINFMMIDWGIYLFQTLTAWIKQTMPTLYRAIR